MYYPTLNKLNQNFVPAEEESAEDESAEEKSAGDESAEEEDEDAEDEEGITEPRSSSLDRLTFDLMVNHKYLAKTHPTFKIQEREFQQRILKHRKDIMKLIHECFRHLDEGDSNPLCRSHLMEKFQDFAKLALEDIEHSKLPETDELFST